MYEVSSSPENGNKFYSFASDFNPLPKYSLKEYRLPNGSTVQRQPKTMVGLNMKQQMSFAKFVMVVLGCYFVYVIIMANLEWQSNQIGTIFRTVSEKTVQGPSLLLTFK